MFEHFSQQALKVVMYSQEEARKARQGMVTTDHILGGILRDGNNIACLVLQAKGVSLGVLRHELQSEIGDGRSSAMEIHFSDEARTVFDLAEAEAKLFQHPYVEPDHLFLGLLQAGEGKGVRALEKSGLNLAHLRWNILRQRYVDLQAHLQTANLERYSVNLTRLLERGEQQPVVEWSAMIEKMIHFLGMQRKHNVLLVGEHGVGKTSLIQGLNQFILDSRIYAPFSHYRVITLQIDKLLAESANHETLYDTTQVIMNEIRQSRDLIVVLENIHNLFLANKKEMEFVITQQLLTLLEEPTTYCLATTTPTYFDALCQQTSIQHSFQILELSEPSQAFCARVLEHWKPLLEKHHQLTISPEAVERAVQLAPEQRNHQHLPEAALTLLDASAARKAWLYSMAQVESRRIERRLRQLLEQRSQLAPEIEESAAVRKVYDKLKGEILEVELQLQEQQALLTGDGVVLGPEGIA